jgi:hypothetical protein
MAQLIPELLQAHADKLASEAKLDRLLRFVVSEFGKESLKGETTTKANLVERVEELLSSLKNEVESMGEEIGKMKTIFRNLTKGGTSQVIPKHGYSKTTEHEESPIKSSLSSISPSKSQYVSPSKSKMMTSPLASTNANQYMDTFSISSKHPYLHLSPNLRTVTKTSHSGHRFAVIGAKPFTP